MASEINFNSIDETYPIAGKDNDSQGFRDNFGYIKNSLQSAKSEIETLQLTTAKTDDDNDFNFKQISRASFIDCGESFHNGETVNGATLVSYSDGSLQLFNVTSNLTFTLSDFPPLAKSTVGKVRIQITSSGIYDITFAANAGTIKKNVGTANPLPVTATGTYIVDFWSYNGGTTVFMDYVGHFS
jgi:hypothetical protein